MKLKKALLLVVSAILLVAISVGATVAYLTDSETVTNTFTVGNVQIKLDEGDVYEAGETGATTENLGTFKDKGVTRVQENKYKLMPGKVYDKDPMVTVLADSEKCYVRALVTIEYQAAADTVVDTEWIDLNTNNWTWNDPTTTKTEATETTPAMITRVYEVRYNNIVAASTTDTELEKLFNKITVPGTIGNDDLATLEGFKINIVAQAIQAEGFADANAAWTAWNN